MCVCGGGRCGCVVGGRCVCVVGVDVGVWWGVDVCGGGRCVCVVGGRCVWWWG